MMRTKLALLATCMFLSFSAAAEVSAKGAGNPREATVARSRVLLGDVLLKAPAELSELDLGPAPQPGSSRLIHKQDILDALPEGVSGKSLALPDVFRVVRATRKLSVAELEQTTKAALASAVLPRGAKLAALRPKSAISLPAGWTSVRAEVPKPPRKAGKLSTLVTLTFLEGDVTLAQTSVPAELLLPPEAAFPDLKKGDRVVLNVKRGLIEIAATTLASQDADVGDVINFSIVDSSKVLRGRIVSKDPPVAEEVQ